MSEEEKGHKICPKCGEKNKADRTYCKYCGWPLDVITYPDD